jgi:hypothetical protein
MFLFWGKGAAINDFRERVIKARMDRVKHCWHVNIKQIIPKLDS